MKTKSFLLFSTSVFAISLFLIIFHSQPPQSFQNIVTQTHQHIKDFQEQLRDEEEQHLVQEERYLRLVGLEGPPEPWHNTTAPVLVTHARNDDHAAVVAFVRDAVRLPYTVLVYNLGLKPYSLAMVDLKHIKVTLIANYYPTGGHKRGGPLHWREGLKLRPSTLLQCGLVSNYCNSSKCAVIDFDLELFPSHVSDESISAYRPLIIQHALSRAGGVIYCEPSQRWAGAARELGALWARAAGGDSLGVLAWPRRAAVTSLTHPRMFHYFRADADDFLFVQMLDASRLLAASRPALPALMRQWIQCALTLDCIMPIGAQSGGCRFDKKPQYRYSGCHGQDASALSIILGLRSGYEESKYAVRGARGSWRRVGAGAARALFAGLQRNGTEPDERTERAATPAA